jgi:Protein of unknown function (DUF1822)
MTYTFADAREWLLEITPVTQLQLWQKSQAYSTPSSRWRAYVNQICLHAFLDWVENEDSIQANFDRSSVDILASWEFVNGTNVQLPGRRIVLIPSEAIDDNELEVSQEWVDIPNWAGDYYLAAQVGENGNFVRIWGYVSHAELKSKGNYDSLERKYCLDKHYSIEDFSAFWITYLFCQEEEVRAAVPSLPKLSATQAENLVQRLSHSSVTFPRRSVPFITWGALLENKQWCQQLYQKRLQRSLSSQKTINLSCWLEGIYDDLWLSVETLFNSSVGKIGFNFRDSPGMETETVRRAKVINLVTEASTAVMLVISLNREENQQICIHVQLHPSNGNLYLPSNIKLASLLDSGEVLQEIQAREHDDYIQLNRFAGEIGESFNIQVSSDDYQITETFAI